MVRSLEAAFTPIVAQEVLHNTKEVAKSIIHGDEMHPRHQPRVVPFPENGGLDRERRGHQEPAVPTRKGVAIDIGEVFARELLAHLDPFGDIEVGGSIIASHLVFDGWVAHEINESSVGPLLGPGTQAAFLLGCEIVGRGGHRPVLW